MHVVHRTSNATFHMSHVTHDDTGQQVKQHKKGRSTLLATVQPGHVFGSTTADNSAAPSSSSPSPSRSPSPAAPSSSLQQRQDILNCTLKSSSSSSSSFIFIPSAEFSKLDAKSAKLLHEMQQHQQSLVDRMAAKSAETKQKSATIHKKQTLNIPPPPPLPPANRIPFLQT